MTAPSPLPFVPLTEAERHIVKSLSEGNEIDCWIPKRQLREQLVRGRFLRSLLLGRVDLNAAGSAAHQSLAAPNATETVCNLHLKGAVIVGEIDLSGCGGHKPLAHLKFRECLFTDQLKLDDTKLGGLVLDSSVFLGEAIAANGADFDGEVAIRGGMIRSGVVLCFEQAHVHRNFGLSKAEPVVFDPIRVKEMVRLLEGDANLSPGLPTYGEGEPSTFAALCAWLLNTGIQHDDDVRAIGPLSIAFIRIGGHFTLSDVRIKARDNICAGKADKESASTALSASQANIAGDFEVRDCELLGNVGLEFSDIAGQATFAGTLVDGREDPNARSDKSVVNMEGVTIGGHLQIKSSRRDRSTIHGRLRLMGGHIKGQFLLLGVHLEASGPAVQADGAIVDSDFYIGPADVEPYHRTFVVGGLHFPGATIGGQLGLKGATIDSRDAERPALSMRDIKVKGGVFIHPSTQTEGVTHESLAGRTFIRGELRFDDADVTGVFEIVGTLLEAGANGLALRATGIQVKSDFLFGEYNPARVRPSNTFEGCEVFGTVHLAGAKIGGRLLFVGANMQCTKRPVALIASRAVIGGGIFLQPAESASRPIAGNAQAKVFRVCHVVGTLRFDNAQVGRRLELIGSCISHAPSTRPSGDEWDDEPNDFVAIRAAGMQIAGDILFRHTDDNVGCKVDGEIRLIGAEIRGALEMRSGMFTACTASTKASGFLLDAYNSQISRGAIFKCPDGIQGLVLSLKGILGLSYATLGCFFLGDSTPVGPTAVAESAGTVVLQGNLRLDGAQIKESTTLQGVLLSPSFAFEESDRKLAKSIEHTLRKWDLFDPRAIISAQRSSLGSSLLVNLHFESFGLIDLRGANTFSISDQYDDHEPESCRTQRLGWGGDPTGSGWEGVGKIEGVCINQTGFTYGQLFVPSNRKFMPWKTFMRRSLNKKGWGKFAWDSLRDPSWVLDHHREQVRLRLQWIRKQYPNRAMTSQTFRPAPYIELARVLRAQGDHHQADYVSIRRRYDQVRHGTHGPFDRFFQRIYGDLFGFGFSTRKALVTLVALFALNFAFARHGANHPDHWLRRAPSNVLSVPAINLSLSPIQGSPSPVYEVTKNQQADIAETGGKCPSYIAYAIDQSIPGRVVEVSRCEVSVMAPHWYKGLRIILLLLGWIIVPAALLTLSGILREANK